MSGSNHADVGEHWKDALNAAQGFRDAMHNLEGHNAVIGDEGLSLIGTCLARTG